MAATDKDTAEAYRELVRYVVESLLGDDVDFNVEADEGDSQLDIKIFTPDDVRGRVIGRGGRIARAMRSMVTAADIGTGKQVTVDIVD
ncbi:KH domain-containing protein [Persicimonas caeni]|uniref:RNA-binding protein KhpA n=1 Tax=Persicimonas caeni TaxID=2292766 RepID=A0A4Y6PQD1_PERCE|nr:KH domain-containing protein [Persicimonas caeni]QDG49985.1 KH domain-containing protein [Persicimonas caeni]QED31206.1 KH domain-containing protein [Persicimonas caeni]